MAGSEAPVSLDAEVLVMPLPCRCKLLLYGVSFSAAFFPMGVFFRVLFPFSCLLKQNHTVNYQRTQSTVSAKGS